MFKKLFSFIFEPTKYFGSRDISSKFVSFFTKFPWMTYLLAFVITLVIMYFKYVHFILFPLS